VSSTPADDPQPSGPTLIGHIVPVFAGGIVTLLLTMVTNGMMAANGAAAGQTGPLSGTRSLIIVTTYRALFSTIGCHLAARLAPAHNPRIPYALALGTLLLALNVVGALGSRGQVPLWYSLVAIAVTIPCAIVGGATAARVMERSGRS
jgi:hypothetical protein